MKEENVNEIAAEKGETAERNFRTGLGCCQAVLTAFKEETGLSEELLKKLGAPFGGGIGRMRHVCGAAMAMFILEGLLKSDSSREGRSEDYARVREMAEHYAAENGSYICAELLEGIGITGGTEPEKRDEGYYKRRPCPSLCRSAAEIAARYLLNDSEKSL